VYASRTSQTEVFLMNSQLYESGELDSGFLSLSFNNGVDSNISALNVSNAVQDQGSCFWAGDCCDDGCESS